MGIIQAIYFKQKSRHPKYCTRTLCLFMVPEDHIREVKNILRGKKMNRMAEEIHTLYVNCKKSNSFSPQNSRQNEKQIQQRSY